MYSSCKILGSFVVTGSENQILIQFSLITYMDGIEGDITGSAVTA